MRGAFRKCSFYELNIRYECSCALKHFTSPATWPSVWQLVQANSQNLTLLICGFSVHTKGQEYWTRLHSTKNTYGRCSNLWLRYRYRDAIFRDAVVFAVAVCQWPLRGIEVVLGPALITLDNKFWVIDCLFSWHKEALRILVNWNKCINDNLLNCVLTSCVAMLFFSIDYYCMCWIILSLISARSEMSSVFFLCMDEWHLI